MHVHSPRIAIVGAGPAGLTAGVLLHKHGVPFSIFKLRPRPSAKELAEPSGVLDLHEESGLAAIRACDLYTEVISLTGDCTEEMRIADKNGNIVHSHKSAGENRPEISRNALTHLLLSHLPSETIKWGHKLRSAIRSTTSSYTEIELDFDTHGKHTFDLVIGADGAWSKVRRLLTDVKPYYSGRSIITVTIRAITRKYPHLAEQVGRGTYFALGNRHGISAQRGSFDSERVYIFITSPEEDFASTSGLKNETAACAKEVLLSDDAIFGQRGARVKELVAVGCDEEVATRPGESLDIRAQYELPVGHKWESKSGATLIGDAAHLMSPSGEGVNMGMFDALLLSSIIVKAHQRGGEDIDSFHSTLKPLVKSFEADMAFRAKIKAEESQQLNEFLFCEDGAKALADMFKSSVNS